MSKQDNDRLDFLFHPPTEQMDTPPKSPHEVDGGVRQDAVEKSPHPDPQYGEEVRIMPIRRPDRNLEHLPAQHIERREGPGIFPDAQRVTTNMDGLADGPPRDSRHPEPERMPAGGLSDLLATGEGRSMVLLGVPVYPMRMSHYAVLYELKNSFVASVALLSKVERERLNDLEDLEEQRAPFTPAMTEELGRLLVKAEAEGESVGNPYVAVCEFLFVVSHTPLYVDRLRRDDKAALKRGILEMGDYLSAGVTKETSIEVANYMKESKLTKVVIAPSGRGGAASSSGSFT